MDLGDIQGIVPEGGIGMKNENVSVSLEVWVECRPHFSETGHTGLYFKLYDTGLMTVEGEGVKISFQPEEVRSLMDVIERYNTLIGVR